MIEINQIYNLDCVEGMNRIDDCSVDLTVTSPPYGELRKYKGFSWDYKAVAKELYRVTKEGGVVVWVVSDQTKNGTESGMSFEQALFFKNECGFNLYDTMIWDKSSPQAPTESRYYDVFEYMFIFSKGKPKTLNLLCDRKNSSVGSKAKVELKSSREERKTKNQIRITREYGRRFNIWRISRGKNKTEHPAVFPEQLANDHILSWSNPGDLILDPFVGSGTTAKMAMLNGRKYIGFDISKEYVEIANKRIADAECNRYKPKTIGNTK